MLRLDDSLHYWSAAFPTQFTWDANAAKDGHFVTLSSGEEHKRYRS